MTLLFEGAKHFYYSDHIFIQLAKEQNAMICHNLPFESPDAMCIVSFNATE